jgi:hypothetical protein
MTFLRYEFKNWKLNQYVQSGNKGLVGMKLRRNPSLPIARDRAPVRHRALREKLNEIEANGQTVMPIWRLPPWRRLNCDFRQHLTNYQLGSADMPKKSVNTLDIRGVRVKLVTDDRANVGFPTHWT